MDYIDLTNMTRAGLNAISTRDLLTKIDPDFFQKGHCAVIGMECERRLLDWLSQVMPEHGVNIEALALGMRRYDAKMVLGNGSEILFNVKKRNSEHRTGFNPITGQNIRRNYTVFPVANAKGEQHVTFGLTSAGGIWFLDPYARSKYYGGSPVCSTNVWDGMPQGADRGIIKVGRIFDRKVNKGFQEYLASLA